MTELRGLLGCFLFSEDDVFKPIGVLSGGERNRYALARMLLHPSNFLLLDEPTNHLDMRAKDVLLESLEKYNGTVVFVSHDRYFIDKLATRVFEIGDGRVEVFPGNYEDYLWRKQRADSGETRGCEQTAWLPHCQMCPATTPRKTQSAEAHESHQAEADAGPLPAGGAEIARAGRRNRRVRARVAVVRQRRRDSARPNCWPSAAPIWQR